MPIDPADLAAFEQQQPAQPLGIDPRDAEEFAKQQSRYTGSFLPISKDASGKIGFDPNAGILGTVKRAAMLAGQVKSGEVKVPSSGAVPGSVEFGSPESGGERIGEAATVLSPGSAALRLAPGIVSPAAKAAQTAVELGAPLPRGIATDNTGLQAVTQAARQLPYVGTKIGDRLANTSQAASERIAGDAADLSGGITARPDVGETLREPMSGIIQANKKTIDDNFNGLRAAVDTEAPIAPNNLRQAVIDIARSRQASGWQNPAAGLDNFVNLVGDGASFSGLQRARSELADTIDFGAAHGGFTAGDKKQLMAAISKDMETAVRTNARGDPDEAISLYKNANDVFKKLSGENNNVSALLGTKRDSLLAGQIITAANGKTGDPVLLATLKRGLPEADFNRVSGTVLSEMGKNQAGEFSLPLFAKAWSQVGERQKNILFGQSAKNYDDIANLASFLKGADQFRNTSNTAGAGTLAAVGSALATGTVAAVQMGSMVPLESAGVVLAGGYMLAKALARPAGAAAVARMARAAQYYTQTPSAATRAVLITTARDANRTLESLGSSGTELLRQLQSPMKAGAEPE